LVLPRFLSSTLILQTKYLRECDKIKLFLKNSEKVKYPVQIKYFQLLYIIVIYGRKASAKKSVMIRNCTLDLPEADEISVLGYLDCLNTHLLHRNANVDHTVRVLQALYIDLCNLRGEIDINGPNDMVRDRISELERQWTGEVRLLGNLEELNNLELQCSPTMFYKVLINEYKIGL
jgi:hypothetical protein